MPRVVLRTPERSDEAAFLAAMHASRDLHRPYLYPPLTPEAYRSYLAGLGERKAGFLACRTGDGAIVGWINLSEIIRGALQGCFVGYGGIAGFSGQGYMTEALDLALREAFLRLRLHRVEANIQPGNQGSRGLARRCGFECEGLSPRYLKIGGRWRDHERWALRAETWKAARG